MTDGDAEAALYQYITHVFGNGIHAVIDLGVNIAATGSKLCKERCGFVFCVFISDIAD